MTVGLLGAFWGNEAGIKRAARPVINQPLDVRYDGFDRGNKPVRVLGEQALHVHHDMDGIAANGGKAFHGCTTTLWPGVHSSRTVVPAVNEGAPLFCSKTVTSRPWTSTLYVVLMPE